MSGGDFFQRNRSGIFEKFRLVAAVALLGPPFAGMALAEDAPYTGQQAREIASLSEADIAALLAGQGWGLAKPAELNGYPGPLHVLELATELALTPEQTDDINALYEEMRAAAQAAGRVYIAAEAHLSMMFRMGHASPDRLEGLLEDSAEALARLRAVHLAAHLEVTPMLTETQIDTYQRLRGYAEDGAHSGHDGHTGHGNH